MPRAGFLARECNFACCLFRRLIWLAGGEYLLSSSLARFLASRSCVGFGADIAHCILNLDLFFRQTD